MTGLLGPSLEDEEERKKERRKKIPPLICFFHVLGIEPGDHGYQRVSSLKSSLWGVAQRSRGHVRGRAQRVSPG